MSTGVVCIGLLPTASPSSTVVAMATHELLSTSDVADAFKVSVVTASRWLRNGKIPSVRTPGGYYRVRREDVDQLLSTPQDAA